MSLLERITETSSSVFTALLRVALGVLFLFEGLQNSLFPAEIGAGRFAGTGIPSPETAALFIGLFEIICGILLLFGLLTRIVVIPLILLMLLVISTTMLPILLNEGFWRMAQESRVDWLLLLGSIFLLISGAGKWSIDVYLSGQKRRRF